MFEPCFSVNSNFAKEVFEFSRYVFDVVGDGFGSTIPPPQPPPPGIAKKCDSRRVTPVDKGLNSIPGAESLFIQIRTAQKVDNDTKSCVHERQSLGAIVEVL